MTAYLTLDLNFKVLQIKEAYYICHTSSSEGYCFYMKATRFVSSLCS